MQMHLQLSGDTLCPHVVDPDACMHACVCVCVCVYVCVCVCVPARLRESHCTKYERGREGKGVMVMGRPTRGQRVLESRRVNPRCRSHQDFFFGGDHALLNGLDHHACAQVTPTAGCWYYIHHSAITRCWRDVWTRAHPTRSSRTARASIHTALDTYVRIYTAPTLRPAVITIESKK